MSQLFAACLLIIFGVFIPLQTAQAACVTNGGKPVSVSVSFNNEGTAGSTLTVNGKSFHRNTPQCTSPADTGPYTLSCDNDSETRAADSLFAPLCGSSEERGKANSTCWQCGGVIKCDGLDYTAGATSPMFGNHPRCDFDNDNPNWSGDVFCPAVDQSVKDAKKFTYNGNEYDYNGGLIVACGSNNLACGASEECTNLLYPDINNRGRSGAQSCDTYSFESTTFFTPAQGSGTTANSPKACINIGDHLDEMDIAQKALTKNGWIYIMAMPEWMDQIADFIATHPNLSYMLRIHHPGRELSPTAATDWAAAIERNAGKLRNAKRLLLMPVNEPNNPGPGRSVDPNYAAIFISALVQSLDQKGLLNSVVGVTSPMWDLNQDTLTYGYIDQMGGAAFLKQFAVIALASYGHYSDGNGSFINTPNPLMNGKISEFMNHYGLTQPVIIAETGVEVNGTVTYAAAVPSIKHYLSMQAKEEWANVMATCVFSYDPDKHIDDKWIYSHMDIFDPTASTNQLPGTSDPTPRTLTNVISYESCTEIGAPDITNKFMIPNSQHFGFTGTDNYGNTIFGGLKDSAQRPIGGILGFQGSGAGKPFVDTPSVFKSLGLQLNAAAAFWMPFLIHVQPIVQEFTHTATSTLCFESDNGNKQAFPIKERIIIPAPGLNKLRQNGRMAAGYIAPNVSIDPSEYEHLGERNPNTLGSIFANPTCDDPPPTEDVRKNTIFTTDPEIYKVPLDKLPIYLLTKWFNTMTAFGGNQCSDLACIANVLLSFVGKKCTETDCNADANPQMEAHEKIKTPKIKEILVDTTNDLSGKPVGALATFVPGPFDLSGLKHGKVSGQTFEQSIGSNSEPITNVDVNFFGAKTMDTYDKFVNCAIQTDILQKNKGQECTFDENATRIPNTSDWAINPPTGSDPPLVPSGPFADILKAKAAKYGVPQCVMEGVGRIEGGGYYKELPLSECLKTVNNCSAVGPMQFTIGPNPISDCTNKCAAGYCPNAWDSWGNGGNPCRYEDALDAAARYLAAYGKFTSTDGSTQKQQIHNATTAYYGSDNDQFARDRLGGCEYWEFVYKQCNPSYHCVKGKLGA